MASLEEAQSLLNAGRIEEAEAILNSIAPMQATMSEALAEPSQNTNMFLRKLPGQAIEGAATTYGFAQGGGPFSPLAYPLAMAANTASQPLKEMVDYGLGVTDTPMENIANIATPEGILDRVTNTAGNLLGDKITRGLTNKFGSFAKNETGRSLGMPAKAFEGAGLDESGQVIRPVMDGLDKARGMGAFRGATSAEGVYKNTENMLPKLSGAKDKILATIDANVVSSGKDPTEMVVGILDSASNGAFGSTARNAQFKGEADAVFSDFAEMVERNIGLGYAPVRATDEAITQIGQGLNPSSKAVSQQVSLELYGHLRNAQLQYIEQTMGKEAAEQLAAANAKLSSIIGVGEAANKSQSANVGGKGTSVMSDINRGQGAGMLAFATGAPPQVASGIGAAATGASVARRAFPVRNAAAGGARMVNKFLSLPPVRSAATGAMGEPIGQGIQSFIEPQAAQAQMLAPLPRDFDVLSMQPEMLLMAAQQETIKTNDPGPMQIAMEVTQILQNPASSEDDKQNAIAGFMQIAPGLFEQAPMGLSSYMQGVPLSTPDRAKLQGKINIAPNISVKEKAESFSQATFGNFKPPVKPQANQSVMQPPVLNPDTGMYDDILMSPIGANGYEMSQETETDQMLNRMRSNFANRN